jgi:hypothetical protein
MSDSEYLEVRLERWKQALLVLAGASATLFATAIADPSQHPSYRIWRWVLIWLLVEVPAVGAAAVLTLSARWKDLRSVAQQHTAFGFAACAWASLLAFRLKLGYMTATGMTVAVVLLGTALLLGYIWFRKVRLSTPEEMFP